MNQSTINQRLKILIEALEMNPRSFSRKVGVSEGTTRSYIDRGSKPNSDYISAIMTAIAGINIGWFLTGEGEMFLPNADSKTNVSVVKNSGNVIGHNQGGLHQNLAPQNTTTDCEKSLAAAQKEVELLREQLAGKDVLLGAKDDLIAAKEEMLSLLRASRNNSN